MKGLAALLGLAIILTLVLGTTAAEAQEIARVIGFSPEDFEAPEGMAVDTNGNIFVGMAFTGEIVRISPENDTETFAQLPSPGSGFMTGLAFDLAGNLYVAMSSFNSTTHGIWRVTPDGEEVELFASLTVDDSPDGLPRGLVFDSVGYLYVTDSLGGKVWKIDRDGTVRIWKADPLLEGRGPYDPPLPAQIGANGLAFDEEGRYLYVANFDTGSILRIAVRADRTAGDATIFVEDELLVGADGIAFDDNGNLYVAVNSQDLVVVVSSNREVSTFVQGPPLQNPADVRLGVGDQADTLYITNFAMMRFLGLVSESPEPSLLKTTIPTPPFDVPTAIGGVIILIVLATVLVAVFRRR